MDRDKSGGTGLETHVASTLAYLGGWVSGLILVLLEKSNRVVRFHAMQSIVTFGFLHIIIIVLGSMGSLLSLAAWQGMTLPISLVFTILWALVLAFAIVLWILLLLRSYHKQQVLVPLAGDIAFWLMERFGLDAPERDAMAFQGLGGELPHHDERHRARMQDSAMGRAIGSIAVIIWSLFLFVVFNFFSDYIAFYNSTSQGGVTQLLRYPIFTAELSRVLPVLNVALGLNIFGHLAALAWNRYLLRQIIEVVLHVMGLAVAITFLKVFPFDYSGLPIEALAAILPTVTMGVLVLAIIGNVVEIVVRLVRFVTALSVR
ncbi:MAG: hypothetical protein GX600_06070 [Dehalococcoidia bacterium]|jgi:uncharacterized membrane protein|nr:hypothetical protein [Dehalococcoidia bacterium]